MSPLPSRAASLLLALAISAPQAQASPVADADAVKGAILLNLVRFTAWPESTAGREDALVIGVMESDRAAAAIGDVVRSQSVNGRPLVVSRLARIEGAERLSVLFVPGSARLSAAEVGGLAARGVLLVGETSDFLNDGGHVQLLLEKQRMRFRVNRRGLDDAGLSMSSQILKLSMPGPPAADDVAR